MLTLYLSIKYNKEILVITILMDQLSLYLNLNDINYENKSEIHLTY
jgi:hypothetical protein